MLLEPTGYAWNLDSLPHGLAGLLIILMGLFTVHREWGTRIGRLYLLYTLSLAGWVLSLAIMFSSLDDNNSLIWTRLGNAGIAFLPAIFFHITTVLLNLDRVRRGLIQLFWLLSAGFAFAALVDNQFVTGLYHYDWGQYGKYGPFSMIFLVYFTSLILYTINLYIQVSRRAKHGSNLQIRAKLLFRSFIIGLFGAIDFLPAYGIDTFPIGMVFLLMLFAISTYVTWRYRLVDISAEYAAENIIKLIHSPLIVLDLDGDVQLTNNAADRLLLMANQQELIGTILPLVKKDLNAENINKQSAIENREFEFNIDGHAHCFNLSVSPLMSPQNTLIAYIFLIRDITARKQSEKFLKQARDDLEKNVLERTRQLQEEVEQHKQTADALLSAKNVAESASQAKTEFLSRISHELRTPLNALLGFTQLLQMDANEMINPEHREYVEQMLKSGEQLHDLIENILDLSRLDMSNIVLYIESVDICPVIQEGIESIKSLTDTRNITIENKINCDEQGKVIADRKRLKQIFTNLVQNAVKYNYDGGKIIIDCEKLDNNYSISITDTGVGISPEDQDRVFEPFEQLDDWRHHSEGAGIGLALSRRLAHEMNGDLNFSSEPGVGSRFWLELPAVL